MREVAVIRQADMDITKNAKVGLWQQREIKL